MPELKYYTVRQTRELRISATNEVDAAALATRVFEKEKYETDQMYVRFWPKVISLYVQEEQL